MSIVSVGYVFDAAEKSAADLRKVIETFNVPIGVTNGAGQTVAHIAAKWNKVDVMEYVLEKDSNLLNQRDGYNCTVLHTAAVKGSFDVVKYLVEVHNADICYLGGRYHDRTAVHGAVEFNHLRILKYFVEERHIDFNVPNRYQSQPPIFLAVKRRNWDVIKYMVEEKHADLTLVNFNDENILFPIVRENAMDLMKYLLDEQKVHVDINWRSHYGETLVHVAAILGRMEMLQYLVVEKGADINVRKRTDKRTPLHYAASRDNMEVCRFLVEHGADASVVDAQNQIPADKARVGRVIEYLESATRLGRLPRSVASPYAAQQPAPALPASEYAQRGSVGRFARSLGYEGSHCGASIGVNCFQNFLYLAQSMTRAARSKRGPENAPSVPPSEAMAIEAVNADNDFGHL